MRNVFLFIPATIVQVFGMAYVAESNSFTTIWQVNVSMLD